MSELTGWILSEKPVYNCCFARRISGANWKSMRARVFGLILLPCFVAVPSLATDSHNATVYVYRTSGFTASAKRPSIYVDGVEIARLHDGTYLKFELTLGQHLITSATYVEGSQYLNFESGRQYFFQVKVSSGAKAAFGAALMKLFETPRPKALKDIEKLKETDLKQLSKAQSQ